MDDRKPIGTPDYQSEEEYLGSPPDPYPETP